ncbi:MAG: terminase [Kiloniellales bacterium]
MRSELDRLLTAGTRSILWEPIPGPQVAAYRSPADALLYGGQAGGGKTDLLIGLALTGHRRSIIFRREYEQLKAIIDRCQAIIRDRRLYNAQDRVWRLGDGRRLELGACQHPGDEQKFQGRPHDLKAFDEVSHFLESQFRFLIGWNRTTAPGQRVRVVCTGNPPTHADGEWVIRYWAPWLDEQHPYPAGPGELRWFAALDGKDVEVEDGRPFVHKRELVRPKSRSFIPAAVTDNPYLMATGYVATLQALPEPLRSMLLHGDFGAAQEDDPWQVIPTAWIKAAQARWTAGPSEAMTALGVDVARGGRDFTVLSPRHGPWFAEQRLYPGQTTPDGAQVAALVVGALEDGALVNIDVVGVGTSPFDHLRDNGVAANPLNSAEASRARDRSGRLGFVNKRAEWWWRMREALDPGHGQHLMLPPDRGLLADLAAPRWKLTARGIQVESKEDIMRRIGRSPDRGDAAVYALAEARRAEPSIRRL